MFEKSSERFTYDYEWLYYNGDSNVITDLAFDLNAYSVQFNYIILQRRFNVSPFFGLSKINIKNQTETNNLKAGYYRLPLEFDNAFLTFNFGVNFDTPLNVKKDLLLRTKLAYKLDRSNMLVTAGVAENYKSLSLGVTLFKRISGR
jgi:hypothetical protein